MMQWPALSRRIEEDCSRRKCSSSEAKVAVKGAARRKRLKCVKDEKLYTSPLPTIATLCRPSNCGSPDASHVPTFTLPASSFLCSCQWGVEATEGGVPCSLTRSIVRSNDLSEDTRIHLCAKRIACLRIRNTTSSFGSCELSVEWLGAGNGVRPGQLGLLHLIMVIFSATWHIRNGRVKENGKIIWGLEYEKYDVFRASLDGSHC